MADDRKESGRWGRVPRVIGAAACSKTEDRQASLEHDGPTVDGIAAIYEELAKSGCDRVILIMAGAGRDSLGPPGRTGLSRPADFVNATPLNSAI